MFREAFKYRRAIIPASGWYEWQDRENGKQPWYFTSANEPIALIAALWETWKNAENNEEVVRSSAEGGDISVLRGTENFVDASFARMADVGMMVGEAPSTLGRVHSLLLD